MSFLLSAILFICFSSINSGRLCSLNHSVVFYEHINYLASLDQYCDDNIQCTGKGLACINHACLCEVPWFKPCGVSCGSCEEENAVERFFFDVFCRGERANCVSRRSMQISRKLRSEYHLRQQHMSM